VGSGGSVRTALAAQGQADKARMPDDPQFPPAQDSRVREVLGVMSARLSAGSASAGAGWQVYNGQIRYFRDHGDNDSM